MWHWTQETVTWEDLREWARHPADRRESGGYVLGTLRETEDDHKGKVKPHVALHRKAEAVVSRSAITLDADDLTPDDADDLLLLLEPYRAIAHTTWRHTPEKPRYRIIIATDREMLPEEYRRAVTVLMQRLGWERFDKRSPLPEQFMYRPATQDPETYDWHPFEGDPVVVDEVLAEYVPPEGPELTPAAEPATEPEGEPQPWEVDKARAVLGKAVRQVEGAEGNRNNMVNSWLFVLYRFVKSGCLDRNAVDEALWDAAQRAPGGHKYTRDEFNATRRSAWSDTRPERPRLDDFDDDYVEPLPDSEDAGDDPTRPDLFVDVAALLAGDGPIAPARTAGKRSDGEHLFYEGQVNAVFGDPESGKTWLCLATVVEALREGKRAAVVDMDHNGPGATVDRLLLLGAPKESLTDRGLFRYVEPEDADDLIAVVAALVKWEPAVAVVDSVGEMLPILGLNSSSPDDYTSANGQVLKPLAMAGAAVLAVDHLAQNKESRALGQTGTLAKKRAVGGVSLRVEYIERFVPGRGGKAALSINKDRHGGLRAVCPPANGKGEQSAGLFVLETDEIGTTWGIYPLGAEIPIPSDAEMLDRLDPPPSSIRNAQDRMKWGWDRAKRAYEEWKELQKRGRDEETEK